MRFHADCTHKSMHRPFEIVIDAINEDEASERLTGMGLSVVSIEPVAAPVDTASVEVISQAICSIRKEINGVTKSVCWVGIVLLMIWLSRFFIDS